MKAVVSTVQLTEPIPRDEFDTIDVELVRGLEGFRSMQGCAHISPRAAGQPNRRVGEVVVSV
jgi:hypothetical protein